MPHRSARILVISATCEAGPLPLSNLESAGYVVCLTAEESWRTAIAQAPDLVLLDAQVSGWQEICRSVVCGEPSQQPPPPLLLISDAAARQQRVEALRLGAADCLITPCDPEEVLARVRAHLAPRRSRDSLAKQAAALRHSEELLTLFIRHSPIYAYIKAVQPTESRVLHASENYKDMTGIPGSQMVGKTMEQLFPPEFAAKMTRDDWTVVTRGEVLKLDEDFAGRNYTSIKFPIVQGNRTLLAGYTIDITDLKQAEQQLRAAKTAAEAAIEVKNQFLAKLSHELRTPLTPALLAVSQWARRADLPAVLRDDVAMVSRNLELEAHLLDDLLDVSRCLYGKLSLHRQRIALHEAIEHAVSTVAAPAEAKRLKLGVRLEAKRHRVDGDPARVQQVLWNLLSNAIKFTPPGGHIEINTSDEEDDHVVLRVTDSGRGIEPAILSRLFLPFEQGGAHINHEYGGMGLGLTISKAMVEAHGGTIAAASRGQGKGATFIVRLPLASTQQEAAHATPPDADDATARKLRVLLVEDNADTARLMSRLLRARGYEVRIAGSVSAALRCAGSFDFDLLLSDLGLPDGNGHDLMRKLRATGKTQPAIAISGYGNEDDLRKSAQAGFSEHLVKPIKLEDLQQAIARTLAVRSAPAAP